MAKDNAEEEGEEAKVVGIGGGAADGWGGESSGSSALASLDLNLTGAESESEIVQAMERTIRLQQEQLDMAQKVLAQQTQYISLLKNKSKAKSKPMRPGSAKLRPIPAGGGQSSPEPEQELRR